MPQRSPFTLLCMSTPRANTARADLHAHTTASDGSYTPTQLVEAAHLAGLYALAVTDHDTTGGVAEAERAAGRRLELIPGAELSCEYAGREVHLLALFIRTEHAALEKALSWLRACRRDRFAASLDKLAALGMPIECGPLDLETAWGRRHLAVLLRDAGHVRTCAEAFGRYLADDGPAFVPKQLLPLAEAIELVRDAGGITSLAHPGPTVDRDALSAMKAMGLHAIEADYPSFKQSRTLQLKVWATELGLALTAGSDCHGADVKGRTVGARSVVPPQLDALRRLAYS